MILETASRFLQANDENSAAQNRLPVNDIVALRAAGAVCVIILHHAKKATSEKREAMTLQNMLRGTTDFGAMCDQAYGIRMDEHLYNRGAGPFEIELVSLKDRERLGGLTSIRLAASYKKGGKAFPTSYIDETGNFRPVDYKESKARDEEALNALVQANPMMTITELCEATGIKAYTVKDILKRFGWHKKKESRERERQRHKRAIEAQEAALTCAKRTKRNLHFMGEEAPGRDAKTHEAELQIHREFLRALGKPDVQPGETLRAVAKRTYQAWLVGPYADGQADEYYVPAFDRTLQRLDPDFGFQVTGKPFEELRTPPNGCTGNEPVETASLPELPTPPGAVKKLEPKHESKPEPSDAEVERAVLRKKREQQPWFNVAADATRYLEHGQ